jgi:hypothetical protein
MPNGAPVRRWQSMQWQATMILDGSSGSDSVTSPQLHRAPAIEKAPIASEQAKLTAKHSTYQISN